MSTQNDLPRFDDGPEARKTEAAADDSTKVGGILQALRRSPLVGAALDLTRSGKESRDVQI